ncbi:xanthine dehydrogenase family protein molybdopterin-binding subunit [Roseomonas sp. SSH11]|uniref:Xanthine dehydrogenase family protein molybdopterin-binding subunit n=2 Tax=Pararoseomonas baculiformis TaxID=2820812 RepID=A0ABS4ACR3_9PROT|nr:xanthine dehydrogenase family protein molybdopterin-binding subunit [Pararoseomonas baculiformis]
MIHPGSDAILQAGPVELAIPETGIANLSRRGLLGSAAGALLLGVMLKGRPARAQGEGLAAAAPRPGTQVPAFLEIRQDGTVRLLSPFVEGGQGIATAMAQIVGEELDVDPARFVVDCAPPGADYLVVNGRRLTGGSYSVRSSYGTMRQLGATARNLMIRAAAARLNLPEAELETENGTVIHRRSNRSLTYAELVEAAWRLPPSEVAALRDPATFRWIGKPVPRIDVRDKSTGRAQYAIDLTVENMLHAAVQHAPRLGQEPASFGNEAAVRAMPGVHSIQRLPGAVAVLADSWWRARRAVETLEVTWNDGQHARALPADFSSAGMLAALRGERGAGSPAEENGDLRAAFAGAAKVIEAEYDAPYLAHAQLEPPSAIARFNEDGTLELWLPNQAPEMFQASAARMAGLEPGKVKIHSPMLGGFFGRHFLYDAAMPYPQAIALARAVGRPVKVLWTREEEFLRDAYRPIGFARFRGAVGADGMPVALHASAVGEGPIGRYFTPDRPVDSSMVEGIAGKPYSIAAKRVDCVKVKQPPVISFWRSVGHSMNDFFYESFLDELADAGGRDPFEMRLAMLSDKPRQATLLRAVAELSGGWKRGPFELDGVRRARGVAMASPFGSEVATIAEVSIGEGEIRVHDLWIAIDPGRAVNPAIIEAQVQSAAAIGLSSSLLEEVTYEGGAPQQRNFDTYSILPPARMPRIHVRIVESGAALGGVGEPGVPGVPPAVANAVAALTGQRIRSLPMSKVRLGA